MTIRSIAKHAIWWLHATARRSRGKGPAYCLACRRTVPAFLPYRKGSCALPPVLRDLGIVGSDLDRFRCPRCGSTDRERHLLAYLKSLSQGLFRDKRVLHFAPELSISRLISQHGPKEYIQADLFPANAQVVRMDLTAIPAKTDYFDVVVANHVLEHVADDRKALREIHRVLRPSGHAILQTPFSPRLPATLEIAAVQSSEARMQLYGQEDHVRLYGADIVARFESSGLMARIGRHAEVIPNIDAALYGVNANEPFFLFVKPA